MGKIATNAMAAGEAKTVTTMMKKNRQDRKKTKDSLLMRKISPSIKIIKFYSINLSKLVVVNGVQLPQYQRKLLEENLFV